MNTEDAKAWSLFLATRDSMTSEFHFEICPHCGQALDCRDAAAVFYHDNPDHDRLPVH